MDRTVINQWIISYEIYVRLLCFILILGCLAYWEMRSTWRKSLLNQRTRWFTHLALGGFSAFLVRISYPVLGLGMAVVAEQQHLGLLHTTVHLPFWLIFLFSVLGMDFAMYMEHRWMHRYQIFWRVHQVHHTDTELDVTTGVRFHPIEYFFMMAVKLLAILFLGAPVLAVFVFEVLFMSLTLFNHSNIRLSPVVDYYLRWFLVTPSMHRIHHSDIAFEHNRNFGFCFSFWDRMFNSYLLSPHQGENNLVIGLETHRQQAFQSIQKLLVLPFIKKQKKSVKNLPNHIK